MSLLEGKNHSEYTPKIIQYVKQHLELFLLLWLQRVFPLKKVLSNLIHKHWTILNSRFKDNPQSLSTVFSLSCYLGEPEAF